jgi:hypothetical protein
MRDHLGGRLALFHGRQFAAGGTHGRTRVNTATQKPQPLRYLCAIRKHPFSRERALNCIQDAIDPGIGMNSCPTLLPTSLHRQAWSATVCSSERLAVEAQQLRLKLLPPERERLGAQQAGFTCEGAALQLVIALAGGVGVKADLER